MKYTNIYLTKGSEKMTQGEYYPCVVSHMDTVHKNHTTLIHNNERLEIKEKLSNLYYKNIFFLKEEDIEGPLKQIHFLVAGSKTGEPSTGFPEII